MENFKSLNKEERLQFVCENTIQNYPAFKKALEEGKSNEQFSSMTLWAFFQTYALKSFFLDKNRYMAKLCFYRCGSLDILLTNKYNEKILDAGINHMSYALLSDCTELIEQYAQLKHSLMDKMVNMGIATPIYIMQCLLKEDWNEFERAMAIMKAKTIPKFKMELDALFYQAVAEKNTGNAEAVIHELLTPKQHQMRNKHHILINEFISHPAIGYAKLAWIKGLQVQINNPLVPQELLPINPLDNYNDAPYYPGIDC